MIIQKNFDLYDYTEKFLDHLTKRKKSEETIKGYKKDLKQFGKFLHQTYNGNILTEEIQKGDILDFLDVLEKRGLKDSSIARALSTLKSFYKYLVFEQGFTKNVASLIMHPELKTPTTVILTIDEIERLMETAKRHFPFHHMIFLLLYFTGSRLSPVRTLQRSDINLKNGTVYFGKTKGDKQTTLPLHDELLPLLDDFLHLYRNNGSSYVFPSPKSIHKPISASDIRKKLKQAAELAGIEKRVYPHLLRHIMASRLTALGVGQVQLARLLCHADTRPTNRYIHLDVEHLRPSINLL
ncbi:tyrosine-type recombinase/integrase [Brevibacillus centrosporus]|uniref:tyrosine-type recombinase/integrase n=1 Tax=Brevibacillus centrosporus TaxID=54910 RepID=UPI000F0A9660|nr:tyrosine-type recombinase/integrase [Brevibacillus centrosporus]MEC2130512.1 tyrosine-type recombinase/integrase [Brevibacillus centrosporus]RNB68885.1 hypothetical protein EDM55_15860 [Brevibacillus centrosporus]GED32736.1 tyrosine recombinase XerC [Brevibacillus centrosporus]